MKRNKLIKTASIVVLTAFLVVGIAALPGLSGEEQEEKVMQLTMEQAVKLAEKNDADIKKAEINKERARIDLKKALDTKDKIEKISSFAGYSYDTLLAERVAPEVAKKKSELAGIIYDVSIRGAKLELTNNYYELQKAEGKLKIVRDKAQRSRDSLAIVDTKYKVGTAAKLELDQQKVEVAKTDADVVSAEQAVQKANLKLNKCLGLPVDTIIKPISKVELINNDVNYDAALERAMQDDMELLTAGLKEYSAKLIKNEAASVYTSRSNEYKLADQDLIEARLDKEQATYTVNQKVLNAWDLLENMKRLYEILSAQTAVAEENARLVRCSYEVGVATLYDVNKASDTAAEIKQNLEEAIFGYNLAVKQFEYGIYPATI